MLGSMLIYQVSKKTFDTGTAAPIPAQKYILVLILLRYPIPIINITPGGSPIHWLRLDTFDTQVILGNLIIKIIFILLGTMFKVNLIKVDPVLNVAFILQRIFT